MPCSRVKDLDPAWGKMDVKEARAALDRNVLVRYAAGSSDLDAGGSPRPDFCAFRMASFPLPHGPRSAPAPPFGANVALENRD